MRYKDISTLKLKRGYKVKAMNQRMNNLICLRVSHIGGCESLPILYNTEVDF